MLSAVDSDCFLPERSVVQTEDGSLTLFSPLSGEHYHSIHGAVTESRHIFISAGLQHRIKCGGDFLQVAPLSLFEVGFGTGLNALLTLQYCQRESIPIRYTAVELYPLRPEESRQLHFPSVDSELEGLLQQLHDAPWGEDHCIDSLFTLRKEQQDLGCFLQLPFDNDSLWDVVFFDAFSPEAQPDLWTSEVLASVVQRMRPGGIFVTYCAKGVVRRALQSAGLQMERLPGPPGKREILRGTLV